MPPVSDLSELVAKGWSLAVAESLTGGLLADRAARLPNAARWFRGGLVAYHADVKRDLLGIGDAPPVSEASARSMAANVARLLGGCWPGPSAGRSRAIGIRTSLSVRST